MKRPLPVEGQTQLHYTPYFRYGHTCVTYSDMVYLWGGRADWTNSLCNLLYCYNPSELPPKKYEPKNYSS